MSISKKVNRSPLCFKTHGRYAVPTPFAGRDGVVPSTEEFLMFLISTVSDISAVSNAAASEIDPLVGSLVTLGAFTVTVVIFAAFLSIVRKNKNQIK